MITKDLKRLGYETNPRGPTAEIQNQGPSEGIGLVENTGRSAKQKKKDGARQVEDPEAIQTAAAAASTVEEGYPGSQVQEV